MKGSLKFWGIAALAGCTLFAMPSCSDDYDDSEVKERLDKVENRVTQLEEWCTTTNQEITSLKGLITALESNDYVTGVEILEDGYKVTFSKSGSITIRNGKDGKDGNDGAKGEDGTTPVIGAAKHTDGLYYWTIQTEEGKTNWLVDADGKMIRTTGDNGKDGAPGKDGNDGNDGNDGTPGKDGDNAPTPVLKTGAELGGSYTADAIYISVDSSKTWIKISGEQGKQGEQGPQGPTGPTGPSGAACGISDIEVNGNNVIFTIGTDGTAQTLTIPLYTPILTITGNDEITETGNGNIFTIENDLLKRTDLIIQTRVESKSADGTDFITRSASNRWSIETSLSTDDTGTLSIAVTPAAEVIFHEPALLKVTVSTKDGQLLASGQKIFTNGIFMGTLSVSSLADLNAQLAELDKSKPTDLKITGYFNEGTISADDYDTSVAFYNAIGSFSEIGTLEISVPQITYIPNKTFYEKKNLKVLKSDYITNLDYDGCIFQRSTVEEVYLPNATSLTAIDFSDCPNLRIVDFSGVTKVEGSQVFNHCEKLKALNLPNLTTIDNLNFANFANACYLLEEVNMPKVTQLPNGAFSDCFSLKNISFPEVTTLGEGVFLNCHNLASISLPKVEALPRNTFAGCNSLTKVQTGVATGLPILKEIGESAFADCTSLATVAMFDATSIGKKAFANCKSLTILSLSGGDSTVAADAFEGVDTELCRLQLWKAPTGADIYDATTKTCYGKKWKEINIINH